MALEISGMPYGTYLATNSVETSAFVSLPKSPRCFGSRHREGLRLRKESSFI